MTHSQFDRRAFLEGLAAAGVVSLGAASGLCSAPAPAATPMRPNMAGAYGPWLADTVLGNKPGGLSFRSGKFADVDAWRKAARKRTWECIAPVDVGGEPEARVDAKREFDGLTVEHLSWHLPFGPRTEAVLLK